MFKLSQSRTFTKQVDFKIPADGSTQMTGSFIAEFKRLTVTELRDLPKDATDVEVCRRIVVGWNEITDDNGKQVPFSAEAFDKLLDIVGVAPAIMRTFFETISGIQEKN